MKQKVFHATRLALLLLLGTGPWIGFLQAQDRGVGLGLIVGEPTGLCGKMWVGPYTAVDAAVAWSFLAGGGLYLHGDFLLHLRPFFADSGSPVRGSPLPGSFLFWSGVGGRLKFERETRLGVRLPVGLSWLLPRLPLDAFLEVAPGVDLYPETSFVISAALGLRFFFPGHSSIPNLPAPPDSV